MNRGRKVTVSFGIKPKSNTELLEFDKLQTPISLKSDLGWRENSDLQNLLRKSDIWSDFPEVGLTLVDAEFGRGRRQRLDVLYLRDDGGLLPCELKIGSKLTDSHGQLIRYMAGLASEQLDVNWLRKRQKHFLRAIKDSAAKSLHKEKLDNFISFHKIDKVYLLPKTGILIQENFHSEIMRAVRYLNEDCGFCIRTVEIKPFVADDWNSTMGEFIMRLDFVAIQ
jgi:hypothetical protein